MKNLILFFVAVFLKVIDIASTYYGLNYSNNFTEMNKWVNYSIDLLGLPFALVLNFILFTVGSYVLYRRSEKDRLSRALMIVSFAYFLVCFNNLWVLFT